MRANCDSEAQKVRTAPGMGRKRGGHGGTAGGRDEQAREAEATASPGRAQVGRRWEGSGDL